MTHLENVSTEDLRQYLTEVVSGDFLQMRHDRHEIILDKDFWPIVFVIEYE